MNNLGGKPTPEILDSFAIASEFEAKRFREEAAALRMEQLKAKPIADRLVWAAYARCPCTAGLAYDPCYEDETSPFKGPLSGAWDCSKILLGTADPTVMHTGKLPFAFYKIKSEGQPSANGATTRM
jgi:hypothetical protein